MYNDNLNNSFLNNLTIWIMYFYYSMILNDLKNHVISLNIQLLDILVW